ncbi:MAG: ATP synthase F1 subunit gamma [Firmicutes bacterium]|nr:ATP synthase F1 subunit gamma [Bacillota bacterium]
MAGTRELLQRMKSVQGTQQITRAMKLVSTAKLQKVRSVVEANKAYFKSIQETVRSIMVNSGFDVLQPYMSQKDEGKDAYLVITSDRGLAGGYNSNVCKLTERAITDRNEAVIISIGHKGRDYFLRRGYTVAKEYESVDEVPEYGAVRRIGEELMKEYHEGVYRSIHVVYTSFVNTLTQEAKIMKLYPLSKEEFEGEVDDKAPLMNFEPSSEVVLEYVIKQYINAVLFGALGESAASEQGARMTAMDSATDNAQNIVDGLRLQYNRARQGHITQELTEIINGSNAIN